MKTVDPRNLTNADLMFLRSAGWRQSPLEVFPSLFWNPTVLEPGTNQPKLLNAAEAMEVIYANMRETLSQGY